MYKNFESISFPYLLKKIKEKSGRIEFLEKMASAKYFATEFWL